MKIAGITFREVQDSDAIDGFAGFNQFAAFTSPGWWGLISRSQKLLQIVCGSNNTAPGVDATMYQTHLTNARFTGSLRYGTLDKSNPIGDFVVEATFDRRISKSGKIFAQYKITNPVTWNLTKPIPSPQGSDSE